MNTQLQETYKEIFAHIDAAEHVMLTMHRKPDGDCAGSSLAVSHYLDQIKKPHTAFCVDELGSSLKFLPGQEKVTSDPEHWHPEKAKFDLLIVFDSGDLRHNGIADYVDKLTHDFKIINIDHHATNEGYGHVNLVIDNASSTCEIVHDLLDSINALNKNIATCLMTGLITDTGNFTNLATTASAINTAAKLQLHGANLKQISERTMQNRKYTTLKLWGRALERLTPNKAGIAVAMITRDDILECEADSEAVEGVSNFLNSLDQQTDAKAVLVLTELDPGQIKGSLRTTHPLMDVAKIATLLGGGGHKKAAGFSIDGHIVERNGQYLIEPIKDTSTWEHTKTLQALLEGTIPSATT